MKAIKKVLFAGLWVMMLTGCAIIGTNDRELPTLAVMPFTGIGDKEGETLATLLVNQSEIQNNFTTILRSNILDTIKKKEQEFQRSNITDLDTITDMGKELNADFVVAGSVQSFKGQKLVFLNIIDIKTLQLISGNYQKFGNIEEIPTLLSEMSSRVVKAPKIKTQNMLALAVLPFMIPEGEASEQEAETLAQIAAVEIVNSGKYAVLPRTQAIKTAMKEQENQRELGDQSAMQSLGKAINAKYILAGQTGNVGTKRYFSMQIVNLEKGSLLKGTDEEYHDVKEGIELIPLLVKKVISGRMTEAQKQELIDQQKAEQQKQKQTKAEAEVKRGLAYADKKDYDRAIEAYDAALEIIPGYSQAVTNRQTAVNAKAAALDLLDSGNRYFNEKNYDQAIVQYNAALQIIPGLPQAITNRQNAVNAITEALDLLDSGNKYFTEKSYDQAIAQYDAVLRIIPSYSQAITNRQNAVNAKVKTEVEALLASGNRYLTEKNYDQAIAQYDAALRIIPGLPQAVTNRQQAVNAKQQQAEQERLAKAEAEVKRGLAYADKKDYDRAIEAYDAALRIIPGYSQAVTNRQNAVNAKAALDLLASGNRYLTEKNYDQAIAQYDAALRIVPGLPQAVTNRQQAADAKQKQAEQERLAKAETEVKRGLAYADKKDYDRAIEAYDAALRIVPGYSQAVTNRQTAV
ncbi:tetratricopeptide repeat protein, partial [Breznakiellaceae bacterium SP9]